MAQAFGIPLPPPYKGQNDQIPLIALQNPYCKWMINFNNQYGNVNLRKGNELFAEVNGNPLNITSYEDDLFVMVDDSGTLKWYETSTGSPSLVRSVVGGGDDEVHTLFFNNYLFYFGEGELSPANTGPQYWNGTSWGNAGYSWPSDFNPLGGCVYKNRAYFVNRGTAKYGYSEIDSIAGTVTEVDLSSQVSSHAMLYAIRSISMSENVTQENVLAFLFSTGEVLVYSGSYPNSTSWGVVAKFKVSQLIYNNSMVDAKGDTFIFTETEILSLRNLFLGGYSKERADGIGAVIKNRWSSIVRELLDDLPGNRYYIKAAYDEQRDRIVISLPKYVDPLDENEVNTWPAQFIYDFTLGGWYEYVQTSNDTTRSVSACYFNNDIYILIKESGGDSVVVRLDVLDTYVDDSIGGLINDPIYFYLESAPHPLSKFGVMVASGLEVVMKSDLYPNADFHFIGDLGAQVTTEQPTNGNGTEVSKVLVNAGIEANTIQYVIEGNSDEDGVAVGLEIYGTNLWVIPGEGLAR